jgi:hypothetical protein
MQCHIGGGTDWPQLNVSADRRALIEASACLQKMVNEASGIKQEK